MRITAGLLLAAAVVTLGCISLRDPWAHGEALEESQRRYTEAIRWGEIEKAARYVDPEQREAFLALSDSFQAIRITDYEIGDLDLDRATLAHAEVDVTYLGYVLPEYVERRVNDHQVWYRESGGMGGEWRVRPELASLIEGLGARSVR